MNPEHYEEFLALVQRGTRLAKENGEGHAGIFLTEYIHGALGVSRDVAKGLSCDVLNADPKTFFKVRAGLPNVNWGQALNQATGGGTPSWIERPMSAVSDFFNQHPDATLPGPAAMAQTEQVGGRAAAQEARALAPKVGPGTKEAVEQLGPGGLQTPQNVVSHLNPGAGEGFSGQGVTQELGEKFKPTIPVPGTSLQTHPSPQPQIHGQGELQTHSSKVDRLEQGLPGEVQASSPHGQGDLQATQPKVQPPQNPVVPPGQPPVQGPQPPKEQAVEETPKEIPVIAQSVSQVPKQAPVAPPTTEPVTERASITQEKEKAPRARTSAPSSPQQSTQYQSPDTLIPHKNVHDEGAEGLDDTYETKMMKATYLCREGHKHLTAEAANDCKGHDFNPEVQKAHDDGIDYVTAPSAEMGVKAPKIPSPPTLPKTDMVEPIPQQTDMPPVPSFGKMSIIQKSDDFIIYGPASVAIVDREGDLITGDALRKALPQFLLRARLSLSHLDVLPGEILQSYQDVDRLYKTEVREVTPADMQEFPHLEKAGAKPGDDALFLVGRIYGDNQFSIDVRKEILSGKLRSFSISGQAVKEQRQMVCDGLVCKLANVISEIAGSASTVCSTPMNAAAGFRVVKKSCSCGCHGRGAQ